MNTTNDYIEGTFQNTEFRFAAGSFYGSYTDYWVPVQNPTEGEVDRVDTLLLGGLTVNRVNEHSTEVITLSLPGIALHTMSFPAEGLAGVVSQGSFADDSVPGCPHIEPGTETEVPVAVTILSWEDDQLIGSFTANDASAQTVGTFNLLVSRP